VIMIARLTGWSGVAMMTTDRDENGGSGMDYIRQSRAAWRLAQRHKVSAAAWMIYSSIFHRLNDNYDLTGSVRLTIKEFGILAGITNHTSIRKARQELLDAGLITADGIGSGGPGAAGTYRLVDLIATGNCLRGYLKAVETKETVKPAQAPEHEPVPEPVVESKPESVPEPEPEPVVADGSLFPEPEPESKQEPEKPAEPKPKRKRKAAKPEPEPKKPYGDYGIVMLSDRQVSILEERYPGLWRQYLSRVESYCYNNKKQKRYEDYCKTIINWIQKDQRNHPDWFQQQPEPETEPKREISAAVVEAAKQIESQTPDIFAEARAAREAAWNR